MACRVAARSAWPYLLTPAMFRDCVDRVDIIDTADGVHPPTLRVVYRTAFGVGAVHVCNGVVEHADWEPLRLRRRIVLATAICGVFSAKAAIVDYNARHTWFARYGAGAWIFSLAASASVLAAMSVMVWSLSPSARTPVRAWVPTGLCVLLVLLALGVARGVMPQGVQAASLLASGDVDRARIEAAAVLLVADPSDADARGVVDMVHLSSVRAAGSIEATYERANEPWFSEDVRASALSLLQEQLSAELAKATAASDLGTARRLSVPASLLDVSSQATVRRSIALLEVRHCVKSPTPSCLPKSFADARREGLPDEALAPLRDEGRSVLEARYATAYPSVRTTQDVRQRVAKLVEVIALAEMSRELTGKEPDPGVVRLRDLHRAATAAVLQEERASAEQDRRAREREERRAAREAERLEQQERARSRADAPLLCCDGELSPSCTCGGSHRGCCSRHGGVCGCSQ